MRLRLSLPRTAASVRVARQTVDRIFATFGVRSDCRQEIALAVSEACSNAVQHADSGPDYEIVVETEDAECVITVSDHSRTTGVPEPRAMPRPTATHGRGLAIMNLMMDGIDLQPRPAGGLSTRLFKTLRWNDGALGSLPP
jgi:serine/threonine-protein kinase RsbW